VNEANAKQLRDQRRAAHAANGDEACRRRRSSALRKALASAEESARTQRDQYLRAMAELDNVRKRAQRDIESAHRYALERFAGELLPVRDSLEQACARVRRPMPKSCSRVRRPR
jgi:molecular chaperone GrpE